MRHKIFIAYVVLMVLLFLVPMPSAPMIETGQLDKVVHFGIFLGFALLFYFDRHSRVRWTFLISIAFAGAIELVQWLLPYRDSDGWDFIAGAAGAALGALIVLMLRRQDVGAARTAP